MIISTSLNLSLAYNLDYENRGYKFSFVTELDFAPGEWWPDQEESRYQRLRPFAKNSWVYLRTTFKTILPLPLDFSISMYLKGQASIHNLLPSEQLGLGGYDSVRGYEERAENADEGLNASIELRSPSIPMFYGLKRRGIKEGIQFLAFLDYGLAASYKRTPFEQKFRYLLGTGPGLRYVLDPYLAVRMDVGVKLHEENYGGGRAMLHFMVSLSY